MEWFLHKLEYADPLLLGISDTTNNAKDFAKLKARQIIKHTDTLQELLCPFCDEEHPVSLRENDSKTLLLLCQQGGGKELIDIERVKLFSVDTNRWLQLIQVELLGLKLPLPAIVEQSGLYYLGQIKKVGRVGGISVYYSQRSRTGAQTSEKQAHTVTLLNASIDQMASGDSVMFSLADFLQQTDSKKVFDGKLFAERVQHVFRRIRFNEQNGTVYDGNSLIASLNADSPQYYFFKLLWSKWEQPVSHEEITKYINIQLNTETNSTYQNYANYTKSQLLRDWPKLADFIITKRGSYTLAGLSQE